MAKSTNFGCDEGNNVETNIQVVIRCRQRSEREVHDNSPIIISSSSAKSHEVTIESSVPVSSLGVVTLPPTRTYPFDLVFGPEADQAMIYHNVVAPMLREVLHGYSCTLFAYGQTGVGKTYVVAINRLEPQLIYTDTQCRATCDLTPTPMGNPSA
jgi:kinesin family protein 11